MRGSNDPNENDEKDENNNFHANYKKLLSAMAKGRRGFNYPNKNDEKDENNNFDENYKKIAECNGIRHERVQNPQQKQ